MEHSESPGGDQPLRVEVVPPPVPPESDAVIGVVSETPGVLVSAAMIEGATALSTTEGGNGGNGSEAGGGRATTGSGVMVSKSEEEAGGQSRVVGSSEERALEARGSGWTVVRRKRCQR